ncbi:hypothetical protein [Pseudonocardia sp. TRM90224]|uniref:hypothetical protein n=1 Tax=Pseudonocardia sp. TRM90224 TaxID=2812678 RepID=UPI001E455438|nr:hypothetical protein [Pseudonocardia sp. TRM90224]
MPLIQSCAVQDDLFGLVIVHTDNENGSVEIAGDGLPSVVVSRSEAASVTQLVPIGTRRAEFLTITVDGRPGTVTPGRGSFTRRSHRVDSVIGGTRYRMKPKDEHTSTVLRDGKPYGLILLEPESIELTATWEPHSPQPQDVAVAYALATAFGTGAEHTLILLLEIVGWT